MKKKGETRITLVSSLKDNPWSYSKDKEHRRNSKHKDEDKELTHWASTY